MLYFTVADLTSDDIMRRVLKAVILGKDPVTDEVVVRTPKAVVKAAHDALAPELLEDLR